MSGSDTVVEGLEETVPSGSESSEGVPGRAWLRMVAGSGVGKKTMQEGLGGVPPLCLK